MVEKDFDIAILGHVSNDIMIYGDDEQRFLGGGVVYSSAAAARSGAAVLAVTKAAAEDPSALAIFEENGVSLVAGESPQTTSIRNVYHSADRERRTVTLISRAVPFAAADIPAGRVRIIHLSALVAGEIPDELITSAAAAADVAVDVQGVLRVAESGNMVFRDWEAKARYLPGIRYLKTDAAEAEILTGTADRPRAARMLHDMGAAEVMVTHGSEVLLCSREGLFAAPITARNLSGRTGRGDTCFGAYLARRLTCDVPESLAYATALVSIKMETPGVFRGTPADVEARISQDRMAPRRVR